MEICGICFALLAFAACTALLPARAMAGSFPRIDGSTADAALSGSEGLQQEEPSQELSERMRGMSPGEQIEYLLDAKAMGENSADINFFLGVAMFSTGKLDSAAIFFQEAIAIDSTYSKAYVNLGIVLDSQGKKGQAELMYKRAIEVDPSDVLAHCHLGFLYHSKRRMREAMAYYLKALELDPNSPQAHYNLGFAFADARMFKEALREWELVIQLDPDGELGKTAGENVGLIKQYLELEAPE